MHKECFSSVSRWLEVVFQNSKAVRFLFLIHPSLRPPPSPELLQSYNYEHSVLKVSMLQSFWKASIPAYCYSAVALCVWVCVWRRSLCHSELSLSEFEGEPKRSSEPLYNQSHVAILCCLWPQTRTELHINDIQSVWLSQTIYILVLSVCYLLRITCLPLCARHFLSCCGRGFSFNLEQNVFWLFRCPEQ